MEEGIRITSKHLGIDGYQASAVGDKNIHIVITREKTNIREKAKLTLCRKVIDRVFLDENTEVTCSNCQIEYSKIIEEE